MKRLLLILIFIPCFTYGQQNLTFGPGGAKDTGVIKSALRLDGTFILPGLATNDASQFLSIDGRGKVIRRIGLTQTDIDAAKIYSINRANHFGFQDIASVNGLQTALNGKQPLIGSYLMIGNGFAQANLDVNGTAIFRNITTYANCPSIPSAPTSGCTTYAYGNHFFVICAGDSVPTQIH